MNVPFYLNRIAYTGTLNPSLDTLRALHRAHMFTVPFENLSIHNGERIQLHPDWLFDKIVTRRRGGFCYELNGLFAQLLSEMGFRVDRLSARVARSGGGAPEDGRYGPEFDHMVLLVHLDEPWLVDVGFGASYLEPLRLHARDEQLDPAGKFRIVETEAGLVMQEWVDGKFVNQHLFTLTPYALSAYEGMCHFHQTSPDSSFTKKIVCSKATPNGRLTLSHNRLIRSHHGVGTGVGTKEETMLESAEQVKLVLENDFGILIV